ncbi:Uncharacterised protein [Salmonella enterica subsp. houtenae]|nr:Uncharacterised protein [Salmonella enterica subsp. houtenae]
MPWGDEASLCKGHKKADLAVGFVSAFTSFYRLWACRRALA